MTRRVYKAETGRRMGGASKGERAQFLDCLLGLSKRIWGHLSLREVGASPRIQKLAIALISDVALLLCKTLSVAVFNN
jgi:hypothetical protein